MIEQFLNISKHYLWTLPLFIIVVILISGFKTIHKSSKHSFSETIKMTISKYLINIITFIVIAIFAFLFGN
jgi:hypothetical protein